MSEQETHDLEKLSGQWANAAASDLSGLFGTDVSISSPSIQHADRNTLLPKSGVVICSRCEVAEEERAPILVVLPLQSALVLSVAKEGKSPDEFAAFESSAFEGAIAEAYTGAMDLCVGILGRVLDEEAGLPAIQLRESNVVELPANDDEIASEPYRCARFEFEVTGFPKGQLDILIGAGLATKWFGRVETTATAVSGESGELRIVLVDPSVESRDDFTEITEGLPAQIVCLDPSEVGDESIGELAEASWIILTWDLGGRSGLELLDKLRSDEATSHLKLAIASPAPTRSMVEAALRWGAQTLLYQPWESDEIQERLTEPS